VAVASQHDQVGVALVSDLNDLFAPASRADDEIPHYRLAAEEPENFGPEFSLLLVRQLKAIEQAAAESR
jgi:hypothetical protein